MEYDDIMEILLDSAQTDVNGEVIFEKLPLNVYGTIVFYDDMNYMDNQYSFEIYYKGAEERITLVF